MFLSLVTMMGCSVLSSLTPSKVKPPAAVAEVFQLPASIQFMGSPPAAGISTVYGRSIAVVVGVEDYLSYPAREGGLRAGEDVVAELSSRGFEVQSFFNKNASRKALQQYLYVNLPILAGENDRVLIYFIGRGQKDNNGEAVFMPFDAKDVKEGLSLSILTSLLEGTSAKHTLVINDSVDAGVGLSAGTLTPDRDWNECTRLRKHAYFSSPETQSPQVLATAFLEALSGPGDLNADGISAEDELLHRLNTANPMTQWQSTGAGCLSFKNTTVPKVRDTRFKAYNTKRVQAGTYNMGTADQKISVLQRRDELQHEVRISRDYYVGEAEATYALYEVLGKELPRGVQAEEPIRDISWRAALQFANDLSTFEGVDPCYDLSGPDVLWPKKFACDGWRLPTESEWEFFARAGTQADFATPSGEGALPASLEERDLCSALELSDGTKISDMGWFCGNSDKKIHPVKEKSSNKLGLYDTIGNVWEWTWDWYAPYPDGILDDPVGPFMTSHLCSKDKPGKVSRGGSFSNDIATIRPSFRYCAEPDSSSKSIGFRLVRTAMD